MRFLGLIIIAALAVPALAHDPDPNTVEGQRVAMFKKSGAGIKAVFEQHLPAADLDAVGVYAAEMADWGARMTELFPAGSGSIGARDDIWKNWEDFEAKADQFSEGDSYDCTMGDVRNKCLSFKWSKTSWWTKRWISRTVG